MIANTLISTPLRRGGNQSTCRVKEYKEYISKERNDIMAKQYPINIWINEEKYNELVKVGLADMTHDVLAGMRVLQLKCTLEQKDRILKLYPVAKFDSATTKSIELVPAEAKDKMFNLVIKNGNLDIIDKFLECVK